VLIQTVVLVDEQTDFETGRASFRLAETEPNEFVILGEDNFSR
jgi:hypothetical protein